MPYEAAEALRRACEADVRSVLPVLYLHARGTLERLRLNPTVLDELLVEAHREDAAAGLRAIVTDAVTEQRRPMGKIDHSPLVLLGGAAAKACADTCRGRARLLRMVIDHVDAGRYDRALALLRADMPSTPAAAAPSSDRLSDAHRRIYDTDTDTDGKDRP